MYHYLGEYVGDLDELVTLYGKAGSATDRYFPLVGGIFDGIWKGTMLVQVDPGTCIGAHCDPQHEEGVYRYHLVIRSNPWSWCHHDGSWQQLHAGGIYEMKPELEHFAMNAGTLPRVHLVIDMFGRPNKESSQWLPNGTALAPVVGSLSPPSA